MNETMNYMPDDKIPLVRLLALFIISAITISFEILLGRVFTFSYYSNWGFLIITTAMFGVAMGGVVLHIIVAMGMRHGRNEPFRVEPILLISTIALGLVLPLAWYLLNRLQLDPYQIFLKLSHFLNFAALFFLLSLPFLFASLAIGIFFVLAKSHVGKVYAFDLAGAGLGALLPTLLIAALTPSGVIKMLAVLGLIASILVAVSAKSPRPIKTALTTLALQFIVTVWAFLSSDFGLIYVMPFKPIVKYHKAEKLKHSRWSAIGRIDLYDIPEQNSWGIEYDGGMGHSQILRFDGDLTKVDPYSDKFNGPGFGYFDVFFGLRQNADFLVTLRFFLSALATLLLKCC